MKTLNLVYPEKSDIKYRIDKFPDGQQNIVIEPTPEKLSLDKLSEFFNNIPSKKDDILIKSRLNNWLDLELITCAVASLRELGVEEIHLYTPYIVGARSDRKFQEGGNNYIRDVIAPVINSLNFKTVNCIDPHSDVLEACIKGFRKESNLKLILYWLSERYGNPSFKYSYIGQDIGDFILVSPDAGASKKIYKLAEQIGYKGDIITCSKDRDTDGKLTKTVVPIELKYHYAKNEHNPKDFIIIDDICDGGATFINIAKEIQLKYSDIKPKIYLIVTHGIFSKGTTELSQYFDGIYCTNSYQRLCIVTNDGLKDIPKVKQLNVF